MGLKTFQVAFSQQPLSVLEYFDGFAPESIRRRLKLFSVNIGFPINNHQLLVDLDGENDKFGKFFTFFWVILYGQ